jgi:hypothetical protein
MRHLVKNLRDLNCQDLLAFYQQRRFDDLSEALLAVLEHFRQQAYLSLDPAVQAMVDRFVMTFLFLFTQPDYLLADAHALRFVGMNPIISAVVAMSCFKTTDAYLEILQNNDFEVAYYPDVGLTAESVILSNMRLAPIQIAALGQSVSTWGSQIDYFFSGADVEVADHPERNYSERLVLLPGCGILFNRPTYSPRFPGSSRDAFIINCAWSSPKINPDLCHALAQIVERSSRPVKVRLFCGFGLSQLNSFISFGRELEQILGPNVAELVPHRGYSDYMSLMELGQMSLDSYHFGGCNTVVDSLWVGKPIVTWEGDKWYNRIGPQLMRRVGMPELIAKNQGQYVELALRLIEDDEWRTGLQQRLREVDYSQSLFSTAEAKYFRDAIEYLVVEHERLRSSGDVTPIHIG